MLTKPVRTFKSPEVQAVMEQVDEAAKKMMCCFDPQAKSIIKSALYGLIIRVRKDYPGVKLIRSETMLFDGLRRIRPNMESPGIEISLLRWRLYDTIATELRDEGVLYE